MPLEVGTYVDFIQPLDVGIKLIRSRINVDFIQTLEVGMKSIRSTNVDFLQTLEVCMKLINIASRSRNNVDFFFTNFGSKFKLYRP